MFTIWNVEQLASRTTIEREDHAVLSNEYKEDVKDNNECNDIKVSIECKNESYQELSIGCGEVSIKCKEECQSLKKI